VIYSFGEAEYYRPLPGAAHCVGVRLNATPQPLPLQYLESPPLNVAP
jgi:hypothetical protein